MNKKKNEKGFTIIEVVLVLAIAGLIFLMVFIALPALQRNQRDSQRKADLARVQTALVSYASNNRNALPTNWTTFKSSYLTANGDAFVDPSGPSTTQGATVTDYAFASGPATVPAFSSSQNIIYYNVGSICDTTAGAANGAITTTGAGARKVALRIALEGGGILCVNN